MRTSAENMTARLIVLLLFLLMPKFSFSQSGYPKLIVHNGDTLVAITKHQLDIINVTKVNHDRYKAQLKDVQGRYEGQKVLLLSKQETIDLLKANELDKNGIIANNKLTQDDLNRALRTSEARAEKYRKQRNAAIFATAGIFIVELFHYVMRTLN